MKLRWTCTLLLTVSLGFQLCPARAAQNPIRFSGVPYHPSSISASLQFGAKRDSIMPAAVSGEEGWIKADSEEEYCKHGTLSLERGEWQRAIDQLSLAIGKNKHNAIAFEHRAIAIQMINGPKDDD